MSHQKTIARVENLLLNGRNGEPRLDLLEFSIRQGEVLGLLGTNGAGKSTLLRVIGLLETPDKGLIELFGKRVKQNNVQAFRRRMAVVFQDPLLFNCTIRENVAAGLKYRGLSKNDQEKRVTPWLEKLNIIHLANLPAREVSGGEAQRASLARALVLEPELLLLDEPFANLDAPTRDALLDELGELFAQAKTTALFVSHDREEILRLADRIAILTKGGLAQVGSIDEVFNRPATKDVADIVGVETVVHGLASELADGLCRITVNETELLCTDAMPLGPVLVCIRPEAVVLARPDQLLENATSALNRLHGVIRKITPIGVTLRLDIDCGFPLRAAVTPRSAEVLELTEGGNITAFIKASAIHCIHRGGLGELT